MLPLQYRSKHDEKSSQSARHRPFCFPNANSSWQVRRSKQNHHCRLAKQTYHRVWVQRQIQEHQGYAQHSDELSLRKAIPTDQLSQTTLKFISKCMKFDYWTQIFHEEDLGTLYNAAWLSFSLSISNQVLLGHLFRQDYEQNQIVNSFSRVKSFAFASSPAPHIIILRSLCLPME